MKNAPKPRQVVVQDSSSAFYHLVILFQTGRLSAEQVGVNKLKVDSVSTKCTAGTPPQAKHLTGIVTQYHNNIPSWRLLLSPSGSWFNHEA